MNKVLAPFVLVMAMSCYGLTAEPQPDGKPHTFSFGGPEGREFLLNGEPFQIRAGEMHPQRIPREYWRHRIQAAKAMGLNTISFYAFWNDIEQADGSFDFKNGNRDIAAFMKICAAEGMWVLFRPGPYVCGEWDFGGLPSYLLKNPDAKLRTMEDGDFMRHQERYLNAVAEVAMPFRHQVGGPILLTQLENEYGSWDRKHETAYMKWLKDFWTKKGFGPFNTADGTSDDHQIGVVQPGVAVGLDPMRNQAALDQAVKNNPGVPVFSSETYTGWLRHWGAGNWAPSKRIPSVEWLLKNGHSFSLFMFHGGTSFGFNAGANGKVKKGPDHYVPDITSYDYGAPCGEQGTIMPEFYTYRNLIQKYNPEIAIPELPDAIPAMEIPPFVLEYVAPLKSLAHSPRPEIFSSPPYFESFDQNQGMAIYRTTIPAGDETVLMYSFFHDYGHIFVDGKLIRTVDRREDYKHENKLIPIPARTAESELEIWVEAMGHINFSITMETDRKGLYGDVTLGGNTLTNWAVTPIPLDVKTVSDVTSAKPNGMPGGVFRAEFELDEIADTFIDMSKYSKGTLYVNGVNLGRYWSIGPQLRLFCPASVLRVGKNIITVVDLIQTKAEQVRGCKERNYEFINEETKNANNVW